MSREALGGRLQTTDLPQVHDDFNAEPDLYFAGATIPAGTMVMIDTTDVHCRYVAKATVAGDDTVVGLYTGEGGTGSAAVDYGVGRTALPGDQIRVLRRGAQDALASAFSNTTAVAVRNSLIIAVTTVDGIGSSAILTLNSGASAPGSIPGQSPFVAMEVTATGSATSKIAVFFRCT